MPEPSLINLRVEDRVVAVTVGSTVLTAMLAAKVPCRISVSGESRSGLCGMGICFDCRAIVDGVPHQLTCQLPCREGMVVSTQT